MNKSLNAGQAFLIAVCVFLGGIVLLGSSGSQGVTAILLHGWNGTQATPISIDFATRAQATIEYEHHEIHAGDSFYVTEGLTLASAATREYLITTPNTTRWAHILFAIYGSAITTVEVFEDTAKTAGTAMSPLNRDRNSGVASTLIFTHTPAAGADGTRIYYAKFGSADVPGNNTDGSNTGYGLTVDATGRAVVDSTTGITGSTGDATINGGVDILTWSTDFAANYDAAVNTATGARIVRQDGLAY